MVPKQAPLIILYGKSVLCMANNGKDTKHTRHIVIILHIVRNGEDFNLHKTVWCEGGLQISDIGTKNVSKDKLNPRVGYTMVTIERTLVQ